MAISDNYVPLVYGRQNNKSPSYSYPSPVNLGPGVLPAFPANTYPIDRGTEPVNYLLYALSNIINPGNKSQVVTPLQALADSIPQVPFREKTGYEWGKPSYIPADVPVTETLQSTPAPVNPRREAANHLYNIINQPDNFEIIKDKPVAAPQAKQPTKTPQKQKALQNLTESIKIARPDYTNIAYGSQVQPVQPTEPPLDESYYRYLRNNGWNDFDARRQAIRYY